MIFSLDVRRARKGDCLLLHYGPADTPKLALIDGGPRRVYLPHLRPRLQQIKQARHLDQDTPLPIDLLMISHVDEDHVLGILDLTKELITTSGVPLARIVDFWHNSFDAVIGHTPDELTAALSGQFGAAALSGGLPADATLVDDDDFPGGRPHEETIQDTLKVLASIEQGHRLRLDADRLHLEPNAHFGGRLVMAEPGGAPVTIGSGLTFRVIGPMKPELAALHEMHQEWLQKLQDEGKSPPAALAAYVDPSVTNLSSIVVVAEAGGKRMLLTGDARGDKILEGLQLAGLLGPGHDSTMHVHLLKVPHHGSDNNVAPEFFSRITADHYVFSGTGEHGNPEREAVRMLLDARGSAPFVAHFTYPIAEIDAARKKDWERKQAQEKARKAKKPSVTVRPDWSPARNALAAFLDSITLADGQTIEVITHDTAPHVIDLLDPLT
ncbi:MAG: hypothetical protein ABW020_01015 [Candidatus Rokuibacteriota bacterium]